MTDLLTLVQWLSPAFPTGAFAYSHGLERAIAAGDVTDAASFASWLCNILHHGAGWQDAVLLNAALQAGADHDALDALARALTPSSERLQESAEQGAALARTVAGLTGRNLPPRLLPVTLAGAAAPLDLPCAGGAALPAGLRRQSRHHRHAPCPPWPDPGAGRPCPPAAGHRRTGPGRGDVNRRQSRRLGPCRRPCRLPARNHGCKDLPHMTTHGPLRVGIGGPVGAGKTTLTEKLARALAPPACRWL